MDEISQMLTMIPTKETHPQDFHLSEVRIFYLSEVSLYFISFKMFNVNKYTAKEVCLCFGIPKKCSSEISAFVLVKYLKMRKTV